MECNLAQAKQWVSALDQRRFERALQGSGDAFQHVLAIVPLLLHLNHPQLPAMLFTPPQVLQVSSHLIIKKSGSPMNTVFIMPIINHQHSKVR